MIVGKLRLRDQVTDSLKDMKAYFKLLTTKQADAVSAHPDKS